MCVVLLLPALLWSSGAIARPWIEPGDLRARHSVQWLVDTGCANLPQSTWPLTVGRARHRPRRQRDKRPVP